MASVEQNIATSKKFNENFSKDKSLKWLDEMVSPDYLFHDPYAPNLPKGPEGPRQFLQEFASAAPDLKLTVLEAFGAGDKVATRWIAEGTNTGPLESNPPTGKKFTVEGTTIDCYGADGKLVESWNSWDTHGFMMQLGLAAETPAKGAQAEQRPGVQ